MKKYNIFSKISKAIMHDKAKRLNKISVGMSIYLYSSLYRSKCIYEFVWLSMPVHRVSCQRDTILQLHKPTFAISSFYQKEIPTKLPSRVLQNILCCNYQIGLHFTMIYSNINNAESCVLRIACNGQSDRLNYST